MKNCSFLGCEEEESLPFKCKLCSQSFCAKHRLPEQHDCPRIGIYQTDEYKQAKVSIKQMEIEKAKEKEEKKREKHTQKVQFYDPSKQDRREGYFQPKDRFLMRSAFFTLLEFRHNYLTIIISTVIVATLMSINIIVETALNKSIGFSTDFLWTFLTTFFGVIFIYGGHEIAHVLIAKKLKVRHGHVLWVQGILLGLLSIILPFLVFPSYLIFKENDSKTREKGLAALAGVIWMMVCQIFLLFAIGFEIFSSSILYGLYNLPYLFMFYLIFNLIPFGLTDGRYISNWNRRTLWIILGINILLLISVFVVTSLV